MYDGLNKQVQMRKVRSLDTKMLILPKVSYTFKVIAVKILVIFIQSDKPILRCIWKCKMPVMNLRGKCVPPDSKLSYIKLLSTRQREL